MPNQTWPIGAEEEWGDFSLPWRRGAGVFRHRVSVQYGSTKTSPQCPQVNDRRSIGSFAHRAGTAAALAGIVLKPGQKCPGLFSVLIVQHLLKSTWSNTADMFAPRNRIPIKSNIVTFVPDKKARSHSLKKLRKTTNRPTATMKPNETTISMMNVLTDIAILLCESIWLNRFSIPSETSSLILTKMKTTLNFVGQAQMTITSPPKL